MNVLGLNAYHGDASAALVVDGELVFAVEEERYNRVKHWAGLPVEAIRGCLDHAGLRLEEIDHVAISRDPSAHIEKKILFTLSRLPRFGAVKDRLANAARVRDVREAVAEAFGADPKRLPMKVHKVEHHRAHMASAFLVSPFEEAACLSIDGFGDFLSSAWGRGRGGSVSIDGHVSFPHSVGILYTAVTQHLGFLRYGDEYKVMGLAPYGEPLFAPELRRVLRLTEQGFELDLECFLHHSDGVAMTWDGGEPTIGRVFSPVFEKRFGPAREPGTPLEERHRNMAASVQVVCEEALFHLLDRLHARTGLRRLCLSGGVAFNSVANGKIHERTPFREIYIQPAAGDAGTAVGAAFSVWNEKLGNPRSFVMRHASWGPSFDRGSIAAALERTGEEIRAVATMREIADPEELCRATAGLVAAGRVVGWFQGRMEWGPRALGNRSILADPRRTDMKDVINGIIKKREDFRPFCPSIMAEHVGEYFEHDDPEPFMIRVYRVRPEKRAAIPAVTHVDGTGRLQSVGREQNDLYWSLLRAFRELTGIPVLLNTSFNENEPIVCRPEEAIACFLRTRMGALAIGPFLIERRVEEGA